MSQKPKPQQYEDAIDPYVRMRVGIFEHVRKKWMDADMLLVYTLMLHLCDWSTGVWHGSAIAMKDELNHIWGERKLERIFKTLRDRNYISSRHQKGRVGNYDILINNFIPTMGPNINKKLRPVNAGKPLKGTVKSDAITDKMDATGVEEVPSEQTVSPSNLTPSPSILTASPTEWTVSPSELTTNQEYTQESLQDSSQDGMSEYMNRVPRPGRRINVDEA